jgi:hypothetical protein
MSLNDILQIERERVRRERVVLTTVYERMQNRINNSVKVKAKECVYTIPEFIPGYPLINVYKTMEYLLNKLKKEGFIVIQLTMLDLYITWDPIKIKELDKQLKEIEPKKQESSLQNISSRRKVVEKQFERSRDDFVTTLITSKRNEKN